jgi:F420H(2)-dependent quinone reductase
MTVAGGGRRPARATRAFGAVTKAVAPLARFRAGRAAQRGFTAAHTAIYRRFGLARRIGDTPILLLTTTGRRSGRPRTVPVMYVPGEEPVLVASDGGSPTHPAWYLNLSSDPRASVETEGQRAEVVARTVSGKEREPLWRRAVEIYPAYADYQRRTERELPVVVLTPVTCARGTTR